MGENTLDKSNLSNEWGDSSDMIAWGYAFDKESGFLNDDYDCPYLNLEYYKKELKDEEMLIKYYSMYEKEKGKDRSQRNVDAWVLMKYARLYMEHKSYADEKKGLEWLTKHLDEVIRNEGKS